jgi:hypothetical protein
MKYVGLAFAALAIVGALICVGIVVGWFGFSNDANAFETDIPAQYKQMQNVYDNGYKQVLETAQVEQNYYDNFKTLWQGMLTGRYGPNGSQAAFQFIKEANPNLSPELAKKVMEQIETFHSTFSAAQTQMIAKKQAYGRFLTTNTDSRIFNALSGIVGLKYPHIKCGVPDGADDNYQILTSDKTQTDFANHKANVLQIHPPTPAPKAKAAKSGK